MNKKILALISIASFVIIVSIIIFVAVFSYKLGIDQSKIKSGQISNPAQTENQNSNQTNNNKILKEHIGDDNLGAKIITWIDQANIRYSEVYVIKDGKEQLIDEGNTKSLSEGVVLSDLRFSPQKNYLVYAIYPYEGVSASVYDLVNDKFLDVNWSADLLNEKTYEFFGDNEQYLVVCADGNGMGIVKHFSVSQIKPEYKSFYFAEDFNIDYMPNIYLKCYYDKNKQEAILEYGGKILKSYSLPI
jgi:hypothetical protein